MECVICVQLGEGLGGSCSKIAAVVGDLVELFLLQFDWPNRYPHEKK